MCGNHKSQPLVSFKDYEIEYVIYLAECLNINKIKFQLKRVELTLTEGRSEKAFCQVTFEVQHRKRKGM